MSVSYLCPACGREHRSRLMANRQRYFDDVISRLGSVSEICPETEKWVTVTHSDMRWQGPEADRTATVQMM